MLLKRIFSSLFIFYHLFWQILQVQLVPKADMHSRARGVCLVIHAAMPGLLPAPLPLHALYIKSIDVSVTVTILTQGY